MLEKIHALADLGEYTYEEEKKEKIKARPEESSEQTKVFVNNASQSEEENLKSEEFERITPKRVADWIENTWKHEDSWILQEKDLKNLEKELINNPNEVKKLYRKLDRGHGIKKNIYDKQKYVPLGYRLNNANRFVVCDRDGDVVCRIFVDDHDGYEAYLREVSF